MVQQNNQQQKHFRTLNHHHKDDTSTYQDKPKNQNHQYATTANSSKKIEKPKPQKWPNAGTRIEGKLTSQ
jgi:hypothetical protein